MLGQRKRGQRACLSLLGTLSTGGKAFRSSLLAPVVGTEREEKSRRACLVVSVLFLEEPRYNHYVSVPATQGAGGATTRIPRKVKRPAQCWCQIQQEAS